MFKSIKAQSSTGFSLIELLIVITIMSVVTAMIAGSTVNGQRQALFQANVQSLVFQLQELRSLALNQEDQLIFGYGLQYDQQLNKFSSFIDLNGNEQYDQANDNQELIKETDLAASDQFAVFIEPFAKIESESATYTPPLIQEKDIVIIYFPLRKFSCQLYAGATTATLTPASFIQITAASDAAETREQILEQSPHGVISIQHRSCIPELTQNPISQIL